MPRLTQTQPAKLRVGFMRPYTGTFAQLSVAIENSFRLALNEQGGKLGRREIEFFKVDDESYPSKAIENASKLVQRDKVDVLVGTVHSEVQIGIQKVARDSGVLCLIPHAGVNAATRALCAPNVFRTTFSNAQPPSIQLLWPVFCQQQPAQIRAKKYKSCLFGRGNRLTENNAVHTPQNLLIEVRGLHSYWGNSHILHGIDYSLARGQTIDLMGRNGMGKSTLLKSIMGLIKPRHATVLIKERDMTGAAAFEIARLGVAYVPQGRGIFGHLNAQENLKMPARAGSHGQCDWTLERVLEKISPPQTKTDLWRRPIKRRRAANADHWPGLDDQPRGIDSG